MTLTYFQSLGKVCFVVHIHVAYALSVTHDGNVVTLILNGAHKLRGAARYDQVDVTLQ
jgi:hypothetical protein